MVGLTYNFRHVTCLAHDLKITRAVFHVYFQERFFFGKEKINRFEFLICYYSHLKDIEKKNFEET